MVERTRLPYADCLYVSCTANTEEETVDEDKYSLDFPINDFDEFKTPDEKWKSQRDYRKRFVCFH